MPLPEKGSVVSQSSAPVALSNARNFLSKLRGADEDEAAGSDDRPAVVLGARVGQALGRKLRVLAERNPPDESPVLRLIAFSVPQGGATAG